MIEVDATDECMDIRASATWPSKCAEPGDGVVARSAGVAESSHSCDSFCAAWPSTPVAFSKNNLSGISLRTNEEPQPHL